MIRILAGFLMLLFSSQIMASNLYGFPSEIIMEQEHDTMRFGVYKNGSRVGIWGIVKKDGELIGIRDYSDGEGEILYASKIARYFNISYTYSIEHLHRDTFLNNVNSLYLSKAKIACDSFLDRHFDNYCFTERNCYTCDSLYKTFSSPIEKGRLYIAIDSHTRVLEMRYVADDDYDYVLRFTRALMGSYYSVASYKSKNGKMLYAKCLYGNETYKLIWKSNIYIIKRKRLFTYIKIAEIENKHLTKQYFLGFLGRSIVRDRRDNIADVLKNGFFQKNCINWGATLKYQDVIFIHL